MKIFSLNLKELSKINLDLVLFPLQMVSALDAI